MFSSLWLNQLFHGWLEAKKTGCRDNKMNLLETSLTVQSLQLHLKISYSCVCHKQISIYRPKGKWQAAGDACHCPHELSEDGEGKASAIFRLDGPNKAGTDAPHLPSPCTPPGYHLQE